MRARTFFAVSAIVLACSGKTTTDVTPAADAGPTNAPDCPSSTPAKGGTCSKDGLQCEYGADFDPICNTLVLCSGGTWGSLVAQGGADHCPSKPLPDPKNNPADCAATRDGVPEGATCSSTSTCAYDGSTCTCGTFCPSYPIGQPDCDPDAGRTTNCCDRSKVAWYCFDGPKYCPTPRPRIGSACTKEGDRCATSEPVECAQSEMECRDGTWSVANTSCPISTARAKKDIAYVSPADADRLRGQVMGVRLATYRYRTGDDATHLGFVIEDMPAGSPAVLASRDRVDLYGYTSMAVAALQRQQQQIEALERRIVELEKRNGACARR